MVSGPRAEVRGIEPVLATIGKIFFHSASSPDAGRP